MGAAKAAHNTQTMKTDTNKQPYGAKFCKEIGISRLYPIYSY